MAEINAAGTALVYSTYLGGSGREDGSSIAVDPSGNAYVTGATSSSNFPVVNAIYPTYGGGSQNAFVAKISVAPPTTPTSGNTCNGAYNGTFNGNLTVSAGQNCSFVSGGVTGNVQLNGGNLILMQSQVGGDVQLNGGGTFTIGPGTTIGGNLQIQNLPSGSTQNQICGTTIHGDLQFQSNGTAVLIGAGTASCAGNTIGGNLTVQNNTGATTVVGNTITGNLQDHNNTGPTQVSDNLIGNNLQCQNNTSITGGGNTAASKQGQCSAF